MPDRQSWLREATQRLFTVRFSGVNAASENALRSSCHDRAGHDSVDSEGTDLAARPEVGVDSPRLSAELLLCHVLGISRTDLVIHPELPVPPSALPRLEGLLRRRMEGEPVAYLLGCREFFGRDFRVTPATLIPRPETESLIEAALSAFSPLSASPTSPVSPTLQRTAHQPIHFADLGTGSGCIAITLCAERPSWRGLALDRSARALAVATANAARHQVRERLCFVLGDFTASPLAPGSLDLLISNPPYVSLAEYKALSPEVRDFEPATALVPGFCDDGGRGGHSQLHELARDPAGLAHLKAVARAAWLALRPGGLLLMEHGWQQGEALRLWLERHNWENIQNIRDLSGVPRVISGRRPHA